MMLASALLTPLSAQLVERVGHRVPMTTASG